MGIYEYPAIGVANFFEGAGYTERARTRRGRTNVQKGPKSVAQETSKGR